MHHTFEELASREIDGLYQGALFLEAGGREAAEDLLLTTLTAAFHAFRNVGQGTDAAGWLEGRMVEGYLSGIPLADLDGASVEELDMPSPALTGRVEVDPFALHKAAGRVPPRARAALWLVVLRRWKYADASRILGTDLHDLKDLLRYRHLLLTAVLRGPEERNGTDRDLM